MFSVVIHKATRKPTLAAAGLPTLSAATKAADNLHESAKLLASANVLATGVAILVLTDANAESFVATGNWSKSATQDTLYQCGGY